MPDLTFRLSDEDVQRIATAVANIIKQPQAATQSTYTINELSDKLQLSRDTIIDRIRKGEFGEVIRDGQRYRVTAAGLQQYIDRHTGQAYSPAQAKQRQRRIHVNPGRI